VRTEIIVKVFGLERQDKKEIWIPAPNITAGLLVFVQLVMAARTTEP
jgi:hypothetical protein